MPASCGSRPPLRSACRARAVTGRPPGSRARMAIAAAAARTPAVRDLAARSLAARGDLRANVSPRSDWHAASARLPDTVCPRQRCGRETRPVRSDQASAEDRALACRRPATAPDIRRAHVRQLGGGSLGRADLGRAGGPHRGRRVGRADRGRSPSRRRRARGRAARHSVLARAHDRGAARCQAARRAPAGWARRPGSAPSVGLADPHAASATTTKPVLESGGVNDSWFSSHIG